ncbi:MAG TPA: biotin/lipoyl-binding protein [Conexibacter sp.]|jgi:HlyD family secretion protein|nr:biotin/lipoyl-binding protein [Conexibacter sp.]
MSTDREDRTSMHGSARSARHHWSTYVLAAACVGAIVVAVLVVGPKTAASSTRERIVTVARGVVQSTVSGSGTVAAAHELDVNFRSGGQLTHVYVKPGQRVVEGQLLAQIDPTDAQAALDQAEASLAAAQAGGSGSGSGSGGSPASAGATTPATTPTTTTRTTPAATPTTSTAPARSGSSARGSSSGGSSAGASPGGSTSGSSGGGSTGGESSAQRAASVAGAQAAVDQARVALAATSLSAPMTGTVASVGAAAGEQVSGGGSSPASASGSGSASGAGAGASGSGGGSNGAGASTGTGSSGSSAFIVLADLDSMDVVVPFTESDVGKLRVGQPATVTVNALPGQGLAAHVVSIATLATSNGGVVSYDVTLRLDQLANGLKAGMTASAEVVVQRVGDALNVASAAISGRGANATVTLAQGDKRVRRSVVTGVVGDSTTQILGGLSSGDQVAIVTAPVATPGLSGFGAATGGRGGTLGGGGGGRGFGLGGGGGFATGGPPGGAVAGGGGGP